MANYYKDIPEIKFELEQSDLMSRIVELKERGFEDKDQYDEAPHDFADAMDSYDKVLDIVGDIVGNVVAPNAEAVLIARVVVCAMPKRPTRTSPQCVRQA